MARAYLRYAPDDDQRPDPLAPSVLDRAAEAWLDETMLWLKTRIPGMAREQVKFALVAALRRGGSDGFRTATCLKGDFAWPVDMELCRLLADCCNAVPFSLRVVTREWAVRTGLRFPARPLDKIEWTHRGPKLAIERSGEVVSVDHSYAAALVTPLQGLTKITPPVRVFAEDVYANVTQGHHALAHATGETPLADAAP